MSTSCPNQISVGEAFPLEQARVRELLTEYENIGPVGLFGAIVIKDVLARAEQAAISGDLVQILKLYEELKNCQ